MDKSEVERLSIREGDFVFAIFDTGSCSYPYEGAYGMYMPDEKLASEFRLYSSVAINQHRDDPQKAFLRPIGGDRRHHTVAYNDLIYIEKLKSSEDIACAIGEVIRREFEKSPKYPPAER